MSATSPTQNLYIKTYGCQMNVYDSDKIAEVLHPLGYGLVDKPEEANLILLNTCHIREKAAEKLYSDLGRLKPLKIKNNAMLAVAGCVAQAEGDEMRRRAPFLDIIVGPQAYHHLPEMIAKAHRQQKTVLNTDFPLDSKFDALPVSNGAANSNNAQPSSFLTIQEGCDKFCTFCVVPYTRGAEYSRPMADLVTEAKQLVAGGAKEIVLLGQNVNAYHGLTAGGVTVGLGALIKELAALDGVKRLRYTTSHPRDMDEELIQAHGDVPALMPLLHLPVQSGSDAMLKKMNRKHNAELYFEVINKLRAARPDMAFTSDFIVGYPGETTQDFADTVELVQRVNYAQSYSFSYSPRPGTPAAAMDDQVPLEVKKQRLAALQEILNGQQQAYNDASIGQTVPILFERMGRGQLVGRTPHFQAIHVPGNERLVGEILDVTITEAVGNGVKGELVLTESAAA